MPSRDESSSSSLPTLCDEPVSESVSVFICKSRRLMTVTDILRWCKGVEEDLSSQLLMRAPTAHVDFSDNGITGRGVRVLLQAFEDLGIRIRILHLERNKVVDASAIAEFLRCPRNHVEELHLGANPVSLDTCWELLLSAATAKDETGCFKYPGRHGRPLWLHLDSNKVVTQEAIADKILSFLLVFGRPIPEVVKIENPGCCAADNAATGPTSASLAAVHLVCDAAAVVRCHPHVQRQKSRPRRKYCFPAKQVAVASAEDPWADIADEWGFSRRLRPVVNKLGQQHRRLQQQRECRPRTPRQNQETGTDCPTRQQGAQQPAPEDAAAPTPVVSASSDAWGFHEPKHLDHLNITEEPPNPQDAEKVPDEATAPAARPAADSRKANALGELVRLRRAIVLQEQRKRLGRQIEEDKQQMLQKKLLQQLLTTTSSAQSLTSPHRQEREDLRHHTVDEEPLQELEPSSTPQQILVRMLGSQGASGSEYASSCADQLVMAAQFPWQMRQGTAAEAQHVRRCSMKPR